MVDNVKNQERLNNNYNIALNVIKEIIGEDIVEKQMRNVISVGISKRAISRYGICKYKGNDCIIEVSKSLFNVEDKYMIETLIHEILHTFKDTHGHKYRWQMYANKINKNSIYEISRTKNYPVEDKEYKIQIKCLNCGKLYQQHRINKKTLIAIENKQCSCGVCKSHDFEIIKY